MARGRMIIPANVNHRKLEPMGDWHREQMHKSTRTWKFRDEFEH